MQNLVEMFRTVRDVIYSPVYAQAANWFDGKVTSGNDLVKSAINLILIIVVVAAVIFIMFSGLQYVTSQGDATKAKQAMSGITNAIIGLIVAFAAYALVSLVMSQLQLGPVQNIPT